MNVLHGIVVAAFSGFYYVRPDTEAADGAGKGTGAIESLECKPRGKVKFADRIIVGDRVEVTRIDDKTGIIEKIHPRKSQLLRPVIANVDQVVIVLAIKNPDLNLYLADRFLLQAEAQHLDVIVCLNKCDLAAPREVKAAMRHFEAAGYRVLATEAVNNVGQRRLRALLAGRVSVVAGPSGAGKSALLNMVEPGFALRTGSVSEKIGRGKHTTRHTVLNELKTGGFVADTPGFTQLDIEGIAVADLASYFPEFAVISEQCRFRRCVHISEPNCAIKAAVADGIIRSDRYEHYMRFYQELIDQEKRRFH